VCRPLNPYPGHYSRAFAFSAFLYPLARRFLLRGRYRSGVLHRRRSGLPCSAWTPWVGWASPPRRWCNIHGRTIV